MTWLLVLNSVLFVATLTEYLICMKYITNEYEYKNEWFNVLLSILFTPLYSCFFLRQLSWRRVKAYLAPERRRILKYPIISGVLYTIETIFIFYALRTITLSYYTILRSGFIIFNIPWFRYLLQKPVSRLYIISCGTLVISHAFAMSQYILKYEDNGNTVIIVLSCIVNSSYNNLIEYTMTRHGDVLSMIDFQAIFQGTYFILSVPWAIYYTVINAPPMNTTTITMYFFIAFGLQLYMFNKIYILNNKNSAIPANILLSGLDLLRRIIQLTYSFVCFNEPFDTVIGISLIFLGISAGLLLYQYVSDYCQTKFAIRKHQEVLEDEDEDGDNIPLASADAVAMMSTAGEETSSDDNSLHARTNGVEQV
jgi:hypothetical protein